ncbi:MAG: hypothetical protein AB7P04_07375 [Bacteriovoracia bacterium]
MKKTIAGILMFLALTGSTISLNAPSARADGGGLGCVYYPAEILPLIEQLEEAHFICLIDCRNVAGNNYTLYAQCSQGCQPLADALAGYQWTVRNCTPIYR